MKAKQIRLSSRQVFTFAADLEALAYKMIDLTEEFPDTTVRDCAFDLLGKGREIVQEYLDDTAPKIVSRISEAAK